LLRKELGSGSQEVSIVISLPLLPADYLWVSSTGKSMK